MKFGVNTAVMAVGILSLSACQTDKEKTSYVVPTYLKPNSSATLQILEIPEFPKAFNAGMVKKAGDYYLLYRTGDGRVGFGLSILNSNLNLVSSHFVACPRSVNSKNKCEDPRLIEWKNSIYVTFNDVVGKTSGRKMYLSSLQRTATGFELVHQQQLTFGSSSIEKNWSPFVYHNDLYFIYRTTPQFIILKADAENPSQLSEVHRGPQFENPWSYIPNAFPEVVNGPDIRGGTPAVIDPLNDENFATIFHTFITTAYGKKKKIVYLMGAYTFSPEHNYAIAQFSPKPIVLEGMYNFAAEKPVIFPQGLVIEKDRMLISAGIDDEKIAIIDIPRAEFLNN